MRFHLRNDLELDRATSYLAQLTTHKAVVDIKRVQYKHSLAQNRYYYLLINYWATQYGTDSETAKNILKASQPEIYRPVDIHVSDTVVVTKYRSSASLTSKEMEGSITKFKQWSATIEIDLPDADNKAFMEWASDQVANNEAYL